MVGQNIISSFQNRQSNISHSKLLETDRLLSITEDQYLCDFPTFSKPGETWSTLTKLY
jgi:hypothetical protein